MEKHRYQTPTHAMTQPAPQAARSSRTPPGRPEQAATRIVFFIAGFAMSAWAPLVPFAKARSGLDDGALGLLLLCLGIGSIIAMPLAGALAARLGCRCVVTISTLLICLTLPVLATAEQPVWLAIGLLGFGAGLGSLDVTMNIQAVIVERASGQATMSGFHGLFSLGGIAGAACLSALLGLGASLLTAALGVVAAVVVALAAAAPHVLPYGSRSGTTFALPRGIVLFIGSLCFIAFLAEGAMLDWSAIFLTSVRGMTAAYAGVGYATFSLAMTIGRLTGDRVVQRFGGTKVITAGGLCAACGFALATVVPFWSSALAGCALVGLGCSNIVPVLYTSAGRQNVVPEHIAVAAITTLGYTGILAGPAVIGFVAHLAGLSAAFLILALLQLGVAAAGRRLRV